MPCQGSDKPEAGFEHETALREAKEGHRGTHMGFMNAVVTISNHVQYTRRLAPMQAGTRIWDI